MHYESLEKRQLLSLVPVYTASAVANGLYAANGSLFFWTFDNDNPLWATDGSIADTRRIATSDRSIPSSFTAINGRLVAGGSGDLHDDTEVLITDGSQAGALTGRAPVKDGFDSSTSAQVGNATYFVTDGSVVKMTASLATSSVVPIGFDPPTNTPVAVNGRIVFMRSESNDPFPDSLWVSDGTKAGTFALRTQLEAGPIVSTGVNSGSVAYFEGYDSAKGSELWRTDGTPAGTYRVSDLAHGGSSSRPVVLGTIGNSVLFSGKGDSQDGLWTSDGTVAGTQFLASAVVSSSQNAMLVNGKLFLLVRDINADYSVWISDGTAGVTRKLHDFGVNTFASQNHILTSYNNQLVVQIDPPAGGREIYLVGANGTTTQITDDGQQSVSRAFAAVSNGALYISTQAVGSFGSASLWRLSDSQVSISGSAFNDVDADGAQDSTEPPLRRIRVFLDANNNGAFESGEVSQITDSRGRFAFYGLSPGTYHVAEVVPSGTWATTPEYSLPLVAGDHVVKRFGLHLGGGVIAGRVLDAHPFSKTTTNFPGVGGVTVWDDVNRDGVLERGEPSAVSDDVGRYVLFNPPHGTQIIRAAIRSGWYASGMQVTTAAAPATGVGAAAAPMSQLLGYVVPLTPFNDLNNNGFLNDAAGESVIRDPTLIVFQDTNSNRHLDSGESSAHANSSGTFSLTVQQGSTGPFELVSGENWETVSPPVLDPITVTQDLTVVYLPVRKSS